MGSIHSASLVGIFAKIQGQFFGLPSEDLGLRQHIGVWKQLYLRGCRCHIRSLGHNSISLQKHKTKQSKQKTLFTSNSIHKEYRSSVFQPDIYKLIHLPQTLVQLPEVY